jgi:hypothetical protein
MAREGRLLQELRDEAGELLGGKRAAIQFVHERLYGQGQAGLDGGAIEEEIEAEMIEYGDVLMEEEYAADDNREEIEIVEMKNEVTNGRFDAIKAIKLKMESKSEIKKADAAAENGMGYELLDAVKVLELVVQDKKVEQEGQGAAMGDMSNESGDDLASFLTSDTKSKEENRIKKTKSKHRNPLLKSIKQPKVSTRRKAPAAPSRGRLTAPRPGGGRRKAPLAGGAAVAG